MELKIFSIRDAKTETFNTPWFKGTQGEAVRDFATGVNDDKTILNKHPEDFDLYYLGVYDTNKGQIEPLDTPLHVTKAVELKKAVEVPLSADGNSAL